MRTFISEIVNSGVTFETFMETTLKNENAENLVDYYQSVREMMEEVLKLSDNLVDSNKSWREHARFYNEISKIIDLIPLTLIIDIFDMMVPNLISLMKRGSEVLKKESSLLLITLIYYVPNQAKKKKTLDQVIQEFSNTKSSVARKTFIDFCVSALKVCSQ